jgi:hypothetical protein
MLYTSLLLLNLVCNMSSQLLNTSLVAWNLSIDLGKLTLTTWVSVVLISSKADRLTFDVLELLF